MRSTLFDVITIHWQLSYECYLEEFMDNFVIVLSDDNDVDIADSRILTEWREM